MIYLGDFLADETIYIPWMTYNSSGASVTMTGLAVTDIEVYKDGSTTQRSSDAGFTLLDTDGIDFDSTTGLHAISIDTSDNTDAGFYAAGSDYWVVINAVTIDSQTVRILFIFSIENRNMRGTDSAATAANLTTLMNRVGAFTGSGVNTVLGFFQGLMRSDSTTPSDLGGTYDDATDSLQAIRDRGDSAWVTATGFSTHSAADVRTEMDSNSTQLAKLGTPAADVSADIAAVKVDTAATLVDTNELQADWTNGGRLDLLLDAIKAVTDVIPNSGALTNIQSDLDDIQSRLPAALISGRMASDVEAINDNTDAAVRLALSARGIDYITIGVGSTTTNIVSDLSEATNDHFNGGVLLFVTGALRFQKTDITDYDGTSNDLTVTALTEAPANGDIAVII